MMQSGTPGWHSYGLYSYGLYNYGLCRYGLHSRCCVRWIFKSHVETGTGDRDEEPEWETGTGYLGAV